MAKQFDKHQNAWVDMLSGIPDAPKITATAAGKPVFDPAINAWIQPGQNFNTTTLKVPGEKYFSAALNGWVTA